VQGDDRAPHLLPPGGVAAVRLEPRRSLAVPSADNYACGLERSDLPVLGGDGHSGAYHVRGQRRLVAVEQLTLADARRVRDPALLPSIVSLFISLEERSIGVSVKRRGRSYQRLIELLRRCELPRVPCLLALFLAHMLARHVVDAGRQHHTEHHAAQAKEPCHDSVIHSRIIAPCPGRSRPLIVDRPFRPSFHSRFRSGPLVVLR
jgi:hypothetical protein